MAGRPRKSALQLLVQGTYRKHRHDGRTMPPSAPLGAPPDHLSAAAKKAWREVAAGGASAWLRRPDRAQVELYAQLMAEARADFAGMSATRITLLSRQASKLGLGPVDRTRITPQPERAPNPFDEFSDPGEKFFDRNARK